MKTTYSTAADRARESVQHRRRGRRTGEFLALVATTLVCVAGLALVYQAKVTPLADVDQRLAQHVLVDLTRVQSADDLLPGLNAITDRLQRGILAARLLTFLNETDTAGTGRPAIESVGALGRASVSAAEVRTDRRLAFLRERLPSSAASTGETPVPQGRNATADREPRVTLLSAEQLADIKPSFIVRTPAQSRSTFLVAAAVFLAGFWLVHLFGRFRGQRGDSLLLPIAQMLTLVGLLAMTSLRDPLRDVMLFRAFAQGTAVGCVVMAAVSLVDFQRSLLRKLSYVPLAGAFVLSSLLILFGSGPGSSDAHVNLLGVQPVEAIRVLVLLFLAGYFANRWEFLRELKEGGPRPAGIFRWFEVPRLEYVVPVVAGIGLVLLFFFLQKDLGPALVMSIVFLSLYGVARKRLTLVAMGLLLLAAGFAGGYLLDFPHTVVQRVEIWQSPWDNLVRGGDQVSHAIWAMATGGWSGSGLGLGDPRFIPAGHTDLVLAAVGEELGFAGLTVILALYALLAWRALRIALGAAGDYTFFLALGIVVSLALELLLMAGGLLGLVPLTGVVTPFLSYGRSAMLANFAVLGVLLSISERAQPETKPEFRAPVYALAGVLAVLAGIVFLRIGLIQVLEADDFVSAANLTVQADGGRRFEYNPRLIVAARQIVRGTIFDRNGVPLASSRPDVLLKHREEFTQLGVTLDQACPDAAAAGRITRCYPFGGVLFHLLGDWSSKVNWAARNTSFEERDDDRTLRGYDDHARIVDVRDVKTGGMTHVIRRDFRELMPLIRHRYEPDHPAVKRLIERPRDVKMSIDVRLQLRAASILRARAEKAGKKEGAAVVMSDAGDLLAAVSYPWPATPSPAAQAETDRAPDDASDALLDRARYGLYPPGSSFKLVTATAALRKDPELQHATFTCERLPDGRVGTRIHGWARPIRDDVQDTVPHGTLDMPRALVVSCNAYFAQMGMRLGAQALVDTATLFEISLAQPESLKSVRDMLPFVAYGQGQVLASPFKMARVAATMAAGGQMPYGRWVIDDSNKRIDAPKPILSPAHAELMARIMREVVTSGTGRAVSGIEPAIAGKTGTAEVKDAPSHSWFVGFAPYGAPAGQRIAFAVIVEHGGYGASVAAPIAGDLVVAAKQVGLIK